MTLPITLIAARSFDNAIGRNNDIPWKLPTDMAIFKEATRQHPVIMGRRTWQSIPKRFRPLPDRTNIVLTGQPELVEEGPSTFTAYNFLEAVAIAQYAAATIRAGQIFVIGGEAVYTEALPYATNIILSEVDCTVPDATAHFPKFDEDDWTETYRRAYSEECDDYGFTYRILRRKHPTTQILPG